LATQRAQALQSQIATGESFKTLADSMKAFMTPPGAAGNPQRADDLIEINNRVTNLESTMKSGFEELKAIMLMQRAPVAIEEVGKLVHQEEQVPKAKAPDDVALRPDIRVDILVTKCGTTQQLLDWPNKDKRNVHNDEYSSDEFRALAYGVESVCSILTVDKANHTIIASNSDHIMRCVLVVYVDERHSNQNIIEYFGALSETEIALGLASLNEAATQSKDLILGNDLSSMENYY